MTTVKRQGGIIQIHDNRITQLTENVSKTKYCIKHAKNWKEKKRCLNVAQQAKKNAQILLKTQESADECWKCKIVLQKVPKRCPAQSGQA